LTICQQAKELRYNKSAFKETTDTEMWDCEYEYHWKEICTFLYSLHLDNIVLTL